MNKKQTKTKKNKETLNYSKRQEIQQEQNNPRDPNTKMNQRASVGTYLTTESEIFQYHQKNADYIQSK